MTQSNQDQSNQELKRKLAILVAGRIRNTGNITQAINTQDRLSKKSGSWNGEKEIRKWREKK